MSNHQPVSEKRVSLNSLSGSRKRLLALILIAFVPMFVAYGTFFYFPSFAPGGTTNQGALISPPMDALVISKEFENYDTWVLIQAVDGACDEQCKKMFYLSRQVVTGLGKDAKRVQRTALENGETRELLAHLKLEHPDVGVVSGKIPSSFREAPDSPILFLMDPNQNVMMFYSLEKAGKPMLKDLKHLFKVSTIG